MVFLDTSTFIFFCPSTCLSISLLTLTYFGHFWHGSCVWSIHKPWFIVIDVLDLDDELRFRLQGPVRQAVAGLGSEQILGLNLPVQPLDGVDVPCAVINGERAACSLTRQDVLDGAVPFVHI